MEGCDRNTFSWSDLSWSLLLLLLLCFFRRTLEKKGELSDLERQCHPVAKELLSPFAATILLTLRRIQHVIPCSADENMGPFSQRNTYHRKKEELDQFPELIHP